MPDPFTIWPIMTGWKSICKKSLQAELSLNNTPPYRMNYFICIKEQAGKDHNTWKTQQAIQQKKLMPNYFFTP